MSNTPKAGILTFHRSNNYGALFQCYALSKFLKNNGWEPVVIDYQIERTSILQYISRPKKFLGKLRSKGVFSISFVKKRLRDRKGYATEQEFNHQFSDFRNDFLNITPEVYDYQKLLSDCPQADAFIVGSDQVWSQDFVFSSPAYLLGFVPNTKKRISYAPSFGKQELEPFLRPAFRRYIKAFDAVSVRERSGQKIVEDLSGIIPQHVVDPTMLIDDYSEIVDYSLVPNEPYGLAYRLSQSADLTDWVSKSIAHLAQARNLPIFTVSTNSSADQGTQLKPTPGQLLGLIEKADFFGRTLSTERYLR